MVKMEYCALDKSTLASYLFRSGKNGFCRAGNGLWSFSVGRTLVEAGEVDEVEVLNGCCLFCIGCAVFVTNRDWLLVMTPLDIIWELLLPLLLVILLEVLTCEAGVEVIDECEEEDDDEDCVCDDAAVVLVGVLEVNGVLTASPPTNRKEQVEWHRNRDRGVDFLNVLDEDNISESNSLASETGAHLRNIIVAISIECFYFIWTELSV